MLSLSFKGGSMSEKFVIIGKHGHFFNIGDKVTKTNEPSVMSPGLWRYERDDGVKQVVHPRDLEAVDE